MRRGVIWAAAQLCALALLLVVGLPAAAHAQTPTGAKRDAILAYLHDLQRAHQSLVGVQVNEYEVYIHCTSYDRVVDLTHAQPSMVGLELMSAIAYPPYRAYLTDRAAAMSAAGGLVTMSWHHRNPTEVCVRGEYYECAKKPMTAETLNAMLTPGTREHALWLADVNAIGDLLEDWKRRGIVVLFRPYHEMNGDWFWWGKQARYPDLWDALYDELAVRRRLDNLIWVWSGDRDIPDAQMYFPRHHAPDVVGVDVYENDWNSPKYAAGRASVTAVGGAAPFALTEVGMIPSAETLEAINPAWVLLWGGEYLNGAWALQTPCAYCNAPERVAQLVASPRVVTLDEMPPALRQRIAQGVRRGDALTDDNPSCPAQLR